jgi:hypothetical protein
MPIRPQIVLILLTVGIVINVVVAWTLAATRRADYSIDGVHCVDRGAFRLENGLVTWERYDDERIGSSFIGLWRFWEGDWEDDVAPLPKGSPALEPVLPGWASALHPAESAWAPALADGADSADGGFAAAHGFPLLALWSFHEWNPGSGLGSDLESIEEATRVRSGVLHPKDASASCLDALYGEARVFPLGLIWPGFVANSLLYASALYGLLSLSAATRRSIRHIRGRCPSCGYDARATGGVCPECGD